MAKGCKATGSAGKKTLLSNRRKAVQSALVENLLIAKATVASCDSSSAKKQAHATELAKAELVVRRAIAGKKLQVSKSAMAEP